MRRFLFRSSQVLLVFGLLYFIFWALTQFGLVDTKTLVLQTVSLLPGMEDLPVNYELGGKRDDLLKQRERDLARREARLADAQARLAADRDGFTNEKNNWLNTHPQATAVPNSTPGTLVPGQLNPVKSADAKIKNYLEMIGKMQPQQAAVVIQKLPEPTVFAIFDQLSNYQVRKIMEHLPPDYLAKLTQDRLIQYRNI
ncbi:MAG TPA: hypothetical protein VF531_08435 [Bacillota bacterium]